MLILWEHFKTKMKNIGPIERMLHCIKIDKLKKNDPVLFDLSSTGQSRMELCIPHAINY